MSVSLSVAYAGQYHLELFSHHLEEMREQKIGRVYLPLSETDLVSRRPNVDAMSAAARDAGMEAWIMPWGVGGVFGGTRGTMFAAQHLDARQVDSAGESLPAACPNNPRFQHYMETWLQSASETGAGGVLWNEPWWMRHSSLPEYRGMDTSNLWTCHCEHCRRKFRSLYRDPDLPEDPTDETRDFLARSMAAFLRDLGESAHRRGLKSALRVAPHGVATAWRALASEPWLTEVGVSAFWPLKAGPRDDELDFGPSAEGEDEDPRLMRFQRQTEAAWLLLEELTALSGGRGVVWLRCFGISEESENLIEPTTNRLIEMGARHFGIWAFHGMESFGAMACERPREAYEKVVHAARAATTD